MSRGYQASWVMGLFWIVFMAGAVGLFVWQQINR
jgi:hypothetical protein